MYPVCAKDIGPKAKKTGRTKALSPSFELFFVYSFPFHVQITH